jgi:hypothetical protein
MPRRKCRNNPVDREGRGGYLDFGGTTARCGRLLRPRAGRPRRSWSERLGHAWDRAAWSGVMLPRFLMGRWAPRQARPPRHRSRDPGSIMLGLGPGANLPPVPSTAPRRHMESGTGFRPAPSTPACVCHTHHAPFIGPWQYPYGSIQLTAGPLATHLRRSRLPDSATAKPAVRTSLGTYIGISNARACHNGGRHHASWNRSHTRRLVRARVNANAVGNRRLAPSACLPGVARLALAAQVQRFRVISHGTVAPHPVRTVRFRGGS